MSNITMNRVTCVNIANMDIFTQVAGKKQFDLRKFGVLGYDDYDINTTFLGHHQLEYETRSSHYGITAIDNLAAAYPRKCFVYDWMEEGCNGEHRIYFDGKLQYVTRKVFDWTFWFDEGAMNHFRFALNPSAQNGDYGLRLSLGEWTGSEDEFVCRLLTEYRLDFTYAPVEEFSLIWDNEKNEPALLVKFGQNADHQPPVLGYYSNKETGEDALNELLQSPCYTTHTAFGDITSALHWSSPDLFVQEVRENQDGSTT